MVVDQITKARKAVVDDPENPRRNGELGMLYQVYEEYAAAEACYARACAFNPHSFRWNYLLGRTLMSQGNTDRALQILAHAANLNPDYLPAQLGLARMRIELGELDLAEQILQRLVAKDPNFAPAHASLGRVATKRSDFATAAGHYETALAQESAAHTHYALAMVYRQLGKIEQAKEQLRLSESAEGELSSRDPLMTAVQQQEIGGPFEFKQGIDALERGQLTRAMDHFQNVLRNRSDMAADAHFNLGIARARQSQADLAIYHYRQALTIRPAYAAAWNNLGSVYLALLDFDQALNCFRKATELRPRDPKAYINLGDTLHKLGREQEALEQFRKGVECDMSLAVAQRELAAALSRAGLHDEAISHWQEYLRIQPDDAAAWLDYARDLQQTGQDALIQEALQKAAESAPTDASIRSRISNFNQTGEVSPEE